MSRQVFRPKIVGETVSLVFDFASRLSVGETITGQGSTAYLYSGVDATPTAILSGSPSTSGTKVTQKVTGGVVGAIYDVLVTVTTSAGQTLSIGGYVAVNPEPI
jgi:hypothetical protein